MFFQLAGQQEFCSECEWKLNREKIRCSHCNERIPVDQEYVTFARRILHPACKAELDAAGEEALVSQQLEDARRQLAERSTPPPPPAPPEGKSGCGGAAALILALVLALLLV